MKASGYWAIAAGVVLTFLATGATAAYQRLAQAIASAEGFYVAGSRPQRNNNPGDLTVDITGAGIGWDGPFVIYASAADGWAALDQQTEEMLSNTSGIYNNAMTISQVASKYTTTNQAGWAATVAGQLGVGVDTPLSQI
jgi:hypothetical protein